MHQIGSIPRSIKGKGALGGVVSYCHHHHTFTTNAQHQRDHANSPRDHQYHRYHNITMTIAITITTLSHAS